MTQKSGKAGNSTYQMADRRGPSHLCAVIQFSVFGARRWGDIGGFSHQSVQTDEEMRHYNSTARIKQTLHEAEMLGINTLLARTDFHVMRMLMEYREVG